MMKNVTPREDGEDPVTMWMKWADLLGDGSVAGSRVRTRDPAMRPMTVSVAGPLTTTPVAGSLDGVGGEEGHVLRVSMGRSHWVHSADTRLGLGLAGEGGVVDLESGGRDDADVAWDAIAGADFHDVSLHQLLHLERLLDSVAHDGALGRDHVLEGLHHLGARVLLVELEAAGDEDDEDEDAAEVEVVLRDVVVAVLDAHDDEGDEAEGGPSPEEGGEAEEHRLEELDDEGRLLGRRECVGAIAS